MLRTSDWLKLMCSPRTKAAAMEGASTSKGKETRPPTDHNAEDQPELFKWISDTSLVGVVLPYHVAVGQNGLKTEDTERVEARFKEQVQLVLSCGAQAVCVGGLGLGESFDVRARAIAAVRSALDSSASGRALPIVVQVLSADSCNLQSSDAAAKTQGETEIK